MKTKPMKKTNWIAGALLLLMTLAAMADQAPVKLTNTAMKQVISVNDQGKREISFVEPKTVIPGDVILYTIEFENISDQPVSNIVLTDPVPNNSVYREGSAKGDNTQIVFSVDGKQFASADMLFVTEDGKRRLATAKDYRSIRWIVETPLQPGEKRRVSFKTRIKKPGE